VKIFKNVLLVLAAAFLFTGNPSTGFFFARGAFAGTCTTKVNGRAPINSASAGKVFPISAALQQKYKVTGVAFSAAGFPNFSPFAIKSVTPSGLTGDRTKDNALANKAAGYTVQPANTVWHHVEDCVTMQLLPTDIHGAARHTGGAAIILSGNGITVDTVTTQNDAGD
jgi:A nuclease of the HNH/ENDO VII superfamily with conserved WHH